MDISIVNSLPINKILFIIYPLGHLSIALIEWVLISWGIRLWQQLSSLAMIVLPLLLLSTSYDNLILSIGNLIGEGELLESLSMLRFLLHYLIVPLFIVIGVELAHRARAAWATTVVRVMSWVIAFGLAGIDITKNYIGLELEPNYFAGILRYTAANLSGPPIITIVVNLFMVLIGIGIWIRLKWPWLFVGTLIALIGNGISSSSPIVGTFTASISELLMAISLLLTEQQIQFISKQFTQKQDDKFMVDSTFTEPSAKWEVIQKDGYKLYQSGSHIQGNFIQVFAPDCPVVDKQGKLKLITYLHGFALCMPKFYEAHLRELVKQGYYVFFPDFQRSDYPNELEPEERSKENEKKSPLNFWFSVLTDVVFKGNKFNIEDTFNKQQNRRRRIRIVARKLFRPTLFKYLRLSAALVVLILVIKLFNRRYGKHLIKLISTVALSLVHSPSEWINQAIDVTDTAWEKLCQDNPNIAQFEFDFYVFGHSLGGLLALSWPFYIKEGKKESQQKFLPKEVITASPAPSTEMGIPPIALWILKLFNVPFVNGPITIAKTGSELRDIPVGIMHGAADDIVKPKFWIQRSLFQKKANFDYIASQQKKIYFSLSNPQNHPPLVAFHNQAVTKTTYFSNALFKNFGGVKKNPNAYNYQYIWSGLNLVLEEKVRSDELLNKFPLETIKVTDDLPLKSPMRQVIAILLTVVGLLGLGYWLWHSGIVGTSLN